MPACGMRQLLDLLPHTLVVTMADICTGQLLPYKQRGQRVVTSRCLWNETAAGPSTTHSSGDNG